MNLIVLIAVVVIAAILAAWGFFKLAKFSVHTLVVLTFGALTGAIIGALLSVPLSHLPGIYGNVLPIVITIFSILFFTRVFHAQHETMAGMFTFLRTITPHKAAPKGASKNILVDTSVIIDGRIADIARAGFIPGKLLVPRFVLAELQNIADSDDPMRRGRGRRGLEMLNSIQHNHTAELEIIETDLPDIKEVDAKLVALAKQSGAEVLTTDYNLNRVAQIEGVRVLNINELSNAIRPVVLPGEEMNVKVVQAGKERNQGVGYLPDGTMIVIENGDKLIGQEVAAEVTRVFQTVAGKMIFAVPKRGQGAKVAPAGGSRRNRGPKRNGNGSGGQEQGGKTNTANSIEDRLVNENQNRQ